MATYRVGEAGATVFDADGTVAYRLAPGQVVVEGTIDTPPDPSYVHDDVVPDGCDGSSPQRKRVSGYGDKMLRATSDYRDKRRRDG